MPHNVHIVVPKSEEMRLLTLFTHPMSPCTYQGCSYQPWTPFLLASPPLIESECQHSAYLTNHHHHHGVLYILPEKKRTAGMEHITLFPSIYIQTDNKVLTWVHPQGTWPTRWHRYYLQEWNMGEWSMELCSCQCTSEIWWGTYLDYSRGYHHAGVRRGVVNTPPHSIWCGGNHIESTWPLINKESYCYIHMHVGTHA